MDTTKDQNVDIWNKECRRGWRKIDNNETIEKLVESIPNKLIGVISCSLNESWIYGIL